MRTGWKRTWIKLYPYQCLEGSIRYQLTSEERGVWYDLLNFAALCSEPGTIADSDGRPYPHDFIANRLNISLELFKSALSKCLEEGRLTETANGIRITHWKEYQSEYQRQKPYREAKSNDPEKFKKGKYAHIVSRTKEDAKRIKAEREKRIPPNSE